MPINLKDNKFTLEFTTTKYRDTYWPAPQPPEKKWYSWLLPSHKAAEREWEKKYTEWVNGYSRWVVEGEKPIPYTTRTIIPNAEITSINCPWDSAVPDEPVLDCEILNTSFAVEFESKVSSDIFYTATKMKEDDSDLA